MLADEGRRKSMVIYKRWRINGACGFDCELDSIGEWTESVAQAIGSLGLSDKWLVFSYPMRPEKSEVPATATLELLTPDEIASRLEGRVCAISRCGGPTDG